MDNTLNILDYIFSNIFLCYFHLLNISRVVMSRNASLTQMLQKGHKNRRRITSVIFKDQGRINVLYIFLLYTIFCPTESRRFYSLICVSIYSNSFFTCLARKCLIYILCYCGFSPFVVFFVRITPFFLGVILYLYFEEMCVKSTVY